MDNEEDSGVWASGADQGRAAYESIQYVVLNKYFKISDLNRCYCWCTNEFYNFSKLQHKLPNSIEIPVLVKLVFPSLLLPGETSAGLSWASFT